MGKTQRELAFIRDLELNETWTRRFSDLIDKDLDIKDAGKILYINSGTGDHCIAIREKADAAATVFAKSEDEELLKIARDKAAALGSDVDFATIDFEDETFDAVIADGSFTLPEDTEGLIEEAAAAARSGGKVVLIVLSAGSFGEIFSLLWEVLFNEDLGEHGAAAEELIAHVPNASRIEEMAESFGLEGIKTETANEVFEFDNGAAFVGSPLVADFLLPRWLQTLDGDETERVMNSLSKLIDDEDADLTFRFSVKATVLSGRKI